MSTTASRRRFVRNLWLRLIVFLGVILCDQLASAEVTTVILSNNKDATFQVTWTDSKKSQDLEFPLDLALPDALKNAQVIRCELYVVENRPTGSISGQDVAVLDGTEQIGELHLGDQDIGISYRTLLRPTSCDPKKKTLKTTLQSKSPNTDRKYYGGAATLAANQPRLIVTYDSPNPPRSGLSTDWKYAEPASFFSSRLWPEKDSGETLLANPVSYDGAVYLVAGSSSARLLYRIAGAGNVASWPLGFDVTAKYFAFVTASGRLQIMTKDAIHSCDLTTLAPSGSTDKLVCPTTPKDEKITVKPGETPAMGPDGTLYFKNVEAAGNIVARNPALKEIWRTDLKLTDVSPITLNATGRYAYVLAKVAIDDKGATSTIRLLRIDTATGETLPHEISYCPAQSASCSEAQKVKPPLETLLRPAVVSKGSVDYVFIAGNMSGAGVLQLIIFEKDAKPIVQWNRPDKLATAPVLSADGNSLFVAGQDGRIVRYSWYNTAEGKTGAYTESDLKSEPWGNVPGASSILIDANDSVYISANQLLYAYSSAVKKISPASPKLGLAPTLQFTTDGALIGYDSSKVYDFSPKAAPAKSWPSTTLAPNTIYSADSVTAPANPGIKDGDQVILKAKNVTLPSGFHWPVGATLKLQSVQP